MWPIFTTSSEAVCVNPALVRLIKEQRDGTRITFDDQHGITVKEPIEAVAHSALERATGADAAVKPVAFAALALLTACASVNRVSEYPLTSDAVNMSFAQRIYVSVHPTEDVLLTHADTDTIGVIIAHEAPGVALQERAAREFLGDTGCTITGPARPVLDPWTEFPFACPEGFDIRAATAAQRTALRGGAVLTR